MSDTHNVFMPHRHEDDHHVQRLKADLEARGVVVRDASITSDKPNRAKSPEYIRSEILAPGIRNAGKIIVIVTPDTANHSWVDWEVAYAARFPDKKIIGVWAPGSDGCPVPEELEKHGHDMVTWDIDKIIASMSGDTHWERPDGTPRSAPAMSRVGC